MNLLPLILNDITFDDVMFWVYALVVFIVVLGSIILIHEGGHFFFAKKAGILCHEFSIGMGPVIGSVKKGETSYSIRAIPIGGFVSMAGEDTNESILKEGQTISVSFKTVKKSELFLKAPEDLVDEEIEVISEISTTDKVTKDVVGTVVKYDLYSKDVDQMYIILDINGELVQYYVARDAYYVFSKKQKVQIAPFDRCYESKTKLQRFLTVFAGPLMNFVLAFFIFLIVGLASGVPNYESNKLGSVSSGAPAMVAGLQAGDEILSVNGNEITSWNDITKYMNEASGPTIEIVYKRDGNEETVTVPLMYYNYRLGVTNGKVDEDGNLIGVYDATNGLQVTLLFDEKYVVGKAGLKNGDVITQYHNGEKFVSATSWQELIDFLEKNPELATLSIKYIRGEEAEQELTTEIWTADSMNAINKGVTSKSVIGISPESRFDFFGGLGNAFVLFWESITAVFITLGALFFNNQITINELSGPVGIFVAVKQYLGTDILTFLSFVGLISANIGLVNLLPLPALDGGRIVFLGYELVTGKKVNKKAETLLINIVFWLVMALFVYITIKDIIGLF